jgi:hypothetical protein
MHFDERLGSEARLDDLRHLLHWLRPLESLESANTIARSICLPQNMAVTRNNLAKSGKAFYFTRDGEPVLEMLMQADGSFSLKCHYGDLCWMEATLDSHFGLKTMQVFSHVEENFSTKPASRSSSSTTSFPSSAAEPPTGTRSSTGKITSQTRTSRACWRAERTPSSTSTSTSACTTDC